LVHLVLIKFKKDILPDDFQKIIDGAYSLQQIQGVLDLNFGENVSPEGLGQGFSHSLTMKFSTAKDRDSIYLPHPVHQKFVKLFVPFTTDVLVYDYWE
ncbi:Dabb family protein, partial [Flavobacteriaceae bacterium]|nr:Dabb family protein [Flavobacteriaceae bacterium]